MRLIPRLKARRRRGITGRQRDLLENGEPCGLATFCACVRAKLRKPRRHALSCGAIDGRDFSVYPRSPLRPPTSVSKREAGIR